MTEHTLVQEALHLPKREARRWRHMHLDQEDLVADGYVGLVRAARRYDPSQGVPFTAFARHFVRGAIVDTVRRTVRRHSLGDGVYADVRGFSELAPATEGGAAPAFDPPDPGPTPHDAVENRDALRALATLPERERIALLRTVVDGDAAADVARDLGVTAHRVYTLVHDGSARVRKRAA
jgi:RNA polymerase sigma factor (sigma-70 family)